MNTNYKSSIAKKWFRQGFSVICLSGFLFASLATAQSGSLPILFWSQRESSNGHGVRKIFGMNVDGSSQSRMTDTPVQDFFARYSPDGSQIVFTRVVFDANGFRQQIHLMNADGTNQINLSNNLSHNNTPVFSPDGTKIAYYQCSLDFTVCDIWMMDADGGNQRFVAGTTGLDWYPTFSPDGAKIAFYGDGDYEIYVVNADGTNLHPITNDTKDQDYSPDWSPDGSRIVFTRSPNKIFLAASDIYMIDPEGNNEVRLTRGRNDNFYPIWSPDGTQIVFTSGFGIKTDVFVMNADGTGITQLTFGVGEDVASDWK